MVVDEEGGEIQTEEEQDWQQKVDDMEEGPPLYGELWEQVKRSEEKHMFCIIKKQWNISCASRRTTGLFIPPIKICEIEFNQFNLLMVSSSYLSFSSQVWGNNDLDLWPMTSNMKKSLSQSEHECNVWRKSLKEFLTYYVHKNWTDGHKDERRTQKYKGAGLHGSDSEGRGLQSILQRLN